MTRKKVERQKWYDREFYQDLETGYWISVDYPRIRAHRWVWEMNHGKIPKSCHVHHIDGNKSNNDISNLQLLSFKQHAKVHLTKERLSKLKELAEIGRVHAKKWHKSEEGKAWHRFHALRQKFGKNDPIWYKCLQCENTYQSSKLSGCRFCSNKCKSAWRRKEGLDDIEKECEKCRIKFRVNKYAKTRFCSKKCGSGRRKMSGSL